MTEACKEADALIAILGQSPCLNVRGEGDEVWIERGAMYGAPELNFAILKQLSAFFGTDSIEVDDISEPGCESCDYGSKYGQNITLRNVTRNGNITGKFGKE